MAYLRSIAGFFWFLVSSLLGLLACPLKRWGLDPNVFAARVFSRGALWLARVKVRYEGIENLELAKPCIYVANHQDSIDVATFGSIFPRNTKIIAKKELRWLPVFGFYLWAADNVLIDRSNNRKAVTGLDEAVDAVKNHGVSIWIFPEGTRNHDGVGLLPFKKGAFHMAIAAQVPIVILVSSTLKNVAQFECFDLPGGEVKIRVLPPIQTTGMTKDDVPQLMETVRQLMLKTLDEWKN